MKSGYFKELHRLSFIDIKNELKINDDEVKDLIKSLKYNNRNIIIQYLINEDSDGNQSNEYSFNFVGIILYKDIIIKCYPKYLNKEYSNSEKDEILKTIIKVLKKYGKSEKGIIGMSTEEQDKEFNLLSVIAFILTDFIDNGLYSNQNDIYEINGDGEIDWDKTINETIAFMVNKKPFYFDMITKNDISNEIDFFRQMHKYVITQCSKILNETGLTNILSLPIIEFDVDEFLFSDKEYALNQLVKELNIQFVSRKQTVLKVLYSYFSEHQDYEKHSNISMFGTTSFNLVWEKTCAFVLNNQLNNRIDKIDGIDKHTLDAGIAKKKLNALIPFSHWFPKGGNGYKKPNKTIQLDLISIFKKQTERYFVIWDAKYYDLVLTNDSFDNNPGVEDVIKQYVYYLVYADFIKKQHFNYSYNVFLFPSEYSNIKIIGKVDLEILRKALNVNDILLMKMPVKLIFNMYLEEQFLNIGEKVDFII